MTALMAFGGGFIVWSMTSQLSGAVVAPGRIVVDSSVRKVQHGIGGPVASVHVREGDEVKAGDLLIKLDDTVIRANSAILARQIDELEVRSGRLMAERDGKAAISFPRTVTDRLDQPAIAALAADEAALFAARHAAREGQRQQLQQRIVQLRNESEGYRGQKEAKARETALIEQELTGVRALLHGNLVTFTRVAALERQAAALDGTQSQLTAQIAQVAARIAETELQIAQIDESLRNEVMRELSEIQNRLAELLDQLQRVELRAPADGIVQHLMVHAPGNLVSPSEPPLSIVPTHEALFVEARIQPADYDQVRIGQTARIKLHTGTPRTTPELAGQIVRMAVDATSVAPSAPSGYTIRIRLAEGQLERLAGLRLASGMTAEAFIKTHAHTPLAYLLQPLSDQVARAFKER
jgi:HlyD family secretion protein